MKATELEFLKYLYENLPIEEIIEAAEGFIVDEGKDLPDGYEDLVEHDTENTEWDEEECLGCPNKGKCED